MRKKNSFCLLMVVLVGGAWLSLFGAERDHETDILERRRELKRIYDSMNPVSVFGRVVDEAGIAVADADVKVFLERATYLIGVQDNGSSTWVRTDANGLWCFSADKPSRVFVEEVKKNGYEYSTRTNERNISRNLVQNKTTAESPVVTIMRQMGQTTFLIKREGRTSLRAQSPHSQTNRLDLMEERPERIKPDGYEDLRVALNWSTVSNSWSLTFSAPGESAGVVAGTNLLYEAPPEGYQKEVTVGGPPWPTYLYLRSRAIPVYARVDLMYYPWKGGDTNQVLGITYKAWVNPFGDRNLEYDERGKRNWRVENELTEEAKTAIMAGRRFPKPDIPQRIKAMDERVAREKAEKARRTE